LDYYKWKLYNKDQPRPDFLNKEISNDFLDKELFIIGKDGEELLSKDSLLEGVANKYFSELRKSNLTKHEYSSDPEKIEFETVLNILSKILTPSTVRTSIQKMYDIKDGPTLFYHIVAHLFKHRFIDVIINFNFDELLDEILLEELSADSFDSILSDGDCRSIHDLIENKRLRQPLYIKPHGTASHKSTLRFTKDHYHELPNDMRTLIIDLFRKKIPGLYTNKNMNLITVGFGLMSIEFNEILSRTLDNTSAIFSFDWDKFKATSKTDIPQFDKIFAHLKKDDQPKHHNIYHKDIGKILQKDNPDKVNRIPLDALESLDITFCYLYGFIRDIFLPPFKPRDIIRHLIVILFFGNRVSWDSFNTDFEKLNKEKGRSVYPKDYFNSASYFLDRTIIEIMISTTLTQGKVDPFMLISGRAGRYYAQYYEKFLKESDPDKVITFDKLLDTLSLFTRKESEKLNFRMMHIDLNNKGKTLEATFNAVFEYYMGQREPFSEEMMNYLDSLNSRENVKIKNHLRSLFKDLFYVDNSKIQSSLRSPGYHVFKKFGITDLLQTELANNLNYFSALKNESLNTICIVADRAVKLANFLPTIYRLKPSIKIYLLLQKNEMNPFIKKRDSVNVDEIIEPESREGQINIVKNNFKERSPEFFINGSEEFNWFKENVHMIFLPYSKHNHHMTLFLEHDNTFDSINDAHKIERAVYYYKRGFSPVVDPVSLKVVENKRFALQKFIELSHLAFKELPTLNIDAINSWIPFKDINWAKSYYQS